VCFRERKREREKKREREREREREKEIERERERELFCNASLPLPIGHTYIVIIRSFTTITHIKTEFRCACPGVCLPSCRLPGGPLLLLLVYGL
jgi:hypothetical protein